jgi:enoyl-[acyl-carrier protein] reductase II
MLGIKYPIFQGAMAWVSFPELVAAVSNAGGLGILAGTMYEPKELREAIREVKGLTDKPFGVNLLAGSPVIEENMEVIMEEKPAAVTYGIGNPQAIIKRVKETEIKAIPVIPSVRHALRAEKDGADAMVISGIEGGGHVGYIGTLPLVPQAADAVKVPILAAGGIADGRGLAAALTLGAEGVQMGSRFVVSRESPVPLSVKQKVMSSNVEDTVITGNITGLRCRVLKNKLAEEFLKLEQLKASREVMAAFGTGKMRQAFVQGDEVDGSIMIGQVCGMIREVPTCKEIIEEMVSEAREHLERGLSIITS